MVAVSLVVVGVLLTACHWRSSVSRGAMLLAGGFLGLLGVCGVALWGFRRLQQPVLRWLCLHASRVPTMVVAWRWVLVVWVVGSAVVLVVVVAAKVVDWLLLSVRLVAV